MPAGRRSLLYGGGSRREEPGEGDGGGAGLRDASRLETRLEDRAAEGAGEAERSRRVDREKGSVDAGRGVRPFAVGFGVEDFRNGVGL